MKVFVGKVSEEGKLIGLYMSVESFSFLKDPILAELVSEGISSMVKPDFVVSFNRDNAKEFGCSTLVLQSEGALKEYSFVSVQSRTFFTLVNCYNTHNASFVVGDSGTIKFS